ncbi:MAG: hypothetical protein EXS14_04155 [Planctomycetes bacterium]|nr:hypothetical protein [Planctomycetota bacterium]
MQRMNLRIAVLPLVVAVFAAVLASGCGGGSSGGGGSAALGRLIATSFAGNEVVPCNPNAASPLPVVFIDEALEFRFDGPIDAAPLGGLLMVGGLLVEQVGVSPTIGTGGVLYYPFANQGLAQNSLQIRTNQNNSPLLSSYIVGRHKTKLDTIVVDPRVSATNPLGLPFNGGFIASAQYTYFIPPVNLIRSGGVLAQSVGISPLLLPIIPPPCSTQPGISRIFDAGAATGPDPIPAQVLSIAPFSGVAGTALDPMSANDSVVITFSKAIDSSTLNQLQNMTVRNVNQSNQLVPGSLVIQPATPNVVVFTAAPSFGPGPYQIRFSVNNPAGTVGVPLILGVPQGTPPQQLAVSNALEVILFTSVCSTCQAAVSVVEDFVSISGRDATYSPQFNQAAWNAAFDSGFLGGVQITGTPLAAYQGNVANLGTRTQRLITFPGPLGTIGGTVNPPGLVQPFDNPANNLGAAINPQGGSHIQHLYEAVDLGAPRNALELIEWGPVQNFVNQVTYPGYAAWGGMTSTSGPITCPANVNGLSPLYSANYNMSPIQIPDPLNLNPPSNNGNCPMSTTTPAVGTLGAVRLNNPAPYNCGPGFTTYFPFPVFTNPLDYIGSGAGVGNLVVEQNFDPNTVVLLNLNRYRSAANTPARRVVGAPKTLTPNCFSGANASAAAGCDTYDMRFTFVALNSAARSNFYDTNVTVGVPMYQNFALSPGPAQQPAGTTAIWQLEGANAIISPNTPSGPTTGLLTYFTGTPATGTTNVLVLNNPGQAGAPQLTGRRYFRFLSTFRNDAATNGRQRYNNFVMAVSF